MRMLQNNGSRTKKATMPRNFSLWERSHRTSLLGARADDKVLDATQPELPVILRHMEPCVHMGRNVPRSDDPRTLATVSATVCKVLKWSGVLMCHLCMFCVIDILQDTQTCLYQPRRLSWAWYKVLCICDFLYFICSCKPWFTPSSQQGLIVQCTLTYFITHDFSILIACNTT